MNTFAKNFKTAALILLAFGTAFVLCADAQQTDKSNKTAPQSCKQGPRGKFQPRPKFYKAHGMWLAFAELDAEEKQAMLKLQREDPEKFKAEMKKLGEAFFKAEKVRRQELSALVEQYKKANDKDKAEILEKIKSRVRSNFKRRLRQSRMHLEELQERAAKLEKELDRREKSEDKIVDAVVNNIISGKQMNFKKFRPQKHKFAPSKAPLQAE